MKTSTPSKSSKAGSPPKPAVRKKTPLKTRPPKPPVPLPKIILTQLQGISAKALQIAWTEGFLWIVIALCAIVLVQGTIDWMFDLPWRTRFIFALGDLALIGWLAFRHLIQPYRKQLTPEQAALRAEMRWPALRTSLISAVQLAKSPEGSTKMVELLIQQVAKRAAQMNFRTAVDGKHLKKFWLGALALVGVTAGTYVLLAPKSGILLERLLLWNVPLPTETIVEPISGDFSIPAGETIQLVARAKGKIPRAGRVEISYDGKETQNVSVTPTGSSPDTFAISLPNVQQGLTYRFYLNDGRSPEFKVTILHGPVLDSVTFEQDYPAYTNLGKTQLTAGNLTLLAGSKLHVTGRASQELKSARVQLKGINQQYPMLIGDDKKTISCDIPIPVQGMEGFSIIMQNTDSIESQNNTLYRVEVIPDKPPEITFAPGQSEDLTLIETEHPRFRFKVTDDFQVKQVFLCCESVAQAAAGSDETPQADATAPAAEDIKRIPIDVPSAAASLTFDYDWKAAADSGIWKEGKTISYWIEAVDNNNVTGPGIGKSGKRQWRVISIEEKKKELTDKLSEEAEKIDADSEKQKELQKNVGDMIKQQGAK